MRHRLWSLATHFWKSETSWKFLLRVDRVDTQAEYKSLLLTQYTRHNKLNKSISRLENILSGEAIMPFLFCLTSPRRWPSLQGKRKWCFRSKFFPWRVDSIFEGIRHSEKQTGHKSGSPFCKYGGRTRDCTHLLLSPYETSNGKQCRPKIYVAGHAASDKAYSVCVRKMSNSF